MSKVSINIPTYYSAKTLRETLESVKKQTYKDIEIIVIDSHSLDDTRLIAKEYGAKVFSADSLAEARELGVGVSTGEYIMLLDSDQEMERNVISRCVAMCENWDYDGVTLFEESKIVYNTYCERVIAYDKWLFHSLEDDDPVRGTAIPRFFRAKFLKKIDFSKNPPITFEHSMIHNEIVKMGANIRFVYAKIYHYETPTFRDAFRKFRRYGFFYMAAFRVDPTLVINHSMPRRAYFTRLAWSKPTLLAGLFWLYIVKGFATLAGVIDYFLGALLPGEEE